MGGLKRVNRCVRTERERLRLAQRLPLRAASLAAVAAVSTALALSTLSGAWTTAAHKEVTAGRSRPRGALTASQEARRTQALTQNYRPAIAPHTQLQAAWNGIVQQSDLSHATVSAYAYDVTTHQVLAAIHPNERLTPASVMKLFASATAMADLGASFRYVTKVESGPGSSQGATGAIYLVGGGDPWLEADGALTLEQMAKQAAAKIRSASRVIGVGTLFGGSHTGTGWTWNDLPWNYTPNISGLTVERDQLNLLVEPGSPGGPPHVVVNPLNPSINPPLTFLHIDNMAKTAAAGGADTLSVSRSPGTNDIRITGQLPQGGQANTFLSIHDPALLGATLFQQLLARDGVHFQAPAVAGSLPSSGLRTVVSHASQPLSQYLQIQNTYSINVMAEDLLRTLGLRSGGNGSAQSGVAAVDRFLARAHVSVSGVQVDGSGLSPLDEVSASNVVQLLSYSAGQPWFKTFEHSLIHMGRTNQCSFMCGYMDHTSADGTVWLKTGNLSNQWNYAGYAHAQNGNLIAFAILMDGLQSNTFFQQAIGPQDKMTEAVASWPHESGYPKGVTRASVASPPRFLTHLLPVALASGDILGAAAIPVGTNAAAYSYQGERRLEPGLLPRLAVLGAYLQNPQIGVHHTRVIATGALSSGVVHGGLVLSSGGYANLSLTDLHVLAQSVYRRGVRAVTGAIEFVQPPYGGFGGSRLPASLPWEDFGSAFAAPLSRLMTQGDQVSLTVTGARPGVTPVVSGPQPPGLVVENEAVTGAAHSASTVRAVWVRGTNAFKLMGSVPAASSDTVTVTDPHPGEWTAAAFARALTQAGVKVASAAPLRLAAQPHGTVIASLPTGSAAVRSVAARVSRALGDPSARTTLDLYAALGHRASADLSQLLGAHATIADPSGLGLENYMTAYSSARLLAGMWGHRADRPLTASLSRRLWVTKAPEQLTVAGYIREHGRVYAVTLIVNGLPWSGRFAPSASWLAVPGAAKG